MYPTLIAPVFFILHVLVAHAIFLIRPFLKGPITIETPKHNFWPFVPVTLPDKQPDEKPYFQQPDHNFWPFVPVRSPVDKNGTYKYYDVPTHNFWPFIPVAPPRNRTKPIPTTPPPTLPPPDKRYDYGEVLYKSILFYEAQRSGWLPEDRKVTWRSHSALEDQGDFGEDLSGGWYDAGDYVKFGLPMAGATSMLLLGLVEFKDAYRSVNLLDDMYDCVRWPLDYFIKAHPSKFEFYAMVADPYVDHSYWGRPEDMTMYRPSYKLTPDTPGSDVVGETAAAMAAGSIAFKEIDPKYSEVLLNHAKDLFEFADQHRGLYSDSLPIVQEFYSSSGFNDELSWAAAWLYRATGDKQYLQKAEENYQSRECWAVSWDAKDCLAALLLYKLTKKDIYRYDIERTMKSWMPGGSVDYTPGGLAFRTPWGPLRYTANMATLALVAANEGIEPLAYRSWARGQIHYMLGDAGRSFVVGFGSDPPTRPHHAASSCPLAPSACTWWHYTTSDPNPITLYGALVGGPGGDDGFHDYRGDYYQSEVTCDYNSGFQSAVAGLVQMEARQKKLEPLGDMARQRAYDDPKKRVKIHFPTSQDYTQFRPPLRQPNTRPVRPSLRHPNSGPISRLQQPTVRNNLTDWQRQPYGSSFQYQSLRLQNDSQYHQKHGFRNQQNEFQNREQNHFQNRQQNGYQNRQQTDFQNGQQNVFSRNSKQTSFQNRQQQSKPQYPQQNFYQQHNGNFGYADSIPQYDSTKRWWNQQDIQRTLKEKSKSSKTVAPLSPFSSVPKQFQNGRNRPPSALPLTQNDGGERRTDSNKSLSQTPKINPFRAIAPSTQLSGGRYGSERVKSKETSGKYWLSYSHLQNDSSAQNVSITQAASNTGPRRRSQSAQGGPYKNPYMPPNAQKTRGEMATRAGPQAGQLGSTSRRGSLAHQTFSLQRVNSRTVQSQTQRFKLSLRNTSVRGRQNEQRQVFRTPFTPRGSRKQGQGSAKSTSVLTPQSSRRQSSNGRGNSWPKSPFTPPPHIAHRQPSGSPRLSPYKPPDSSKGSSRSRRQKGQSTRQHIPASFPLRIPRGVKRQSKQKVSYGSPQRSGDNSPVPSHRKLSIQIPQSSHGRIPQRNSQNSSQRNSKNNPSRIHTGSTRSRTTQNPYRTSAKRRTTNSSKRTSATTQQRTSRTSPRRTFRISSPQRTSRNDQRRTDRYRSQTSYRNSQRPTQGNNQQRTQGNKRQGKQSSNERRTYGGNLPQGTRRGQEQRTQGNNMQRTGRNGQQRIHHGSMQLRTPTQYLSAKTARERSAENTRY